MNMKIGKVWLASSSPRRRELLEQVGIPFEVVTSTYEETNQCYGSPAELVERQAQGKAMAASVDGGLQPVIGADTIVAYGNRVLGKPENEEDARRMLHLLSGKVHSVITGVCIRYDQRVHTFHCETKVYFYTLSDDDIDAYITTGEPMDKAGAYGIQGKGALFVERIEGSYTNVVGLPVEMVAKALKNIYEDKGMNE
ncbi:Maf family protein [Veillonella magna]|uniref:Maf family protein n=1 Tax=Veillonella magna TaxID=464322 RepID=UPI0026665EA1|nr:Maf family protein [Veillonella magna]